jgi:hypothetical protein
LKGNLPSTLNEKQLKFFKTVLIPNILQHLENLSDIYSNDLSYDISAYLGLDSDALEKLKELKKNEVINEDVY